MIVLNINANEKLNVNFKESFNFDNNKFQEINCLTFDSIKTISSNKCYKMNDRVDFLGFINFKVYYITFNGVLEKIYLIRHGSNFPTIVNLKDVLNEYKGFVNYVGDFVNNDLDSNKNINDKNTFINNYDNILQNFDNNKYYKINNIFLKTNLSKIDKFYNVKNSEESKLIDEVLEFNIEYEPNLKDYKYTILIYNPYLLYTLNEKEKQRVLKIKKEKLKIL